MKLAYPWLFASIGLFGTQNVLAEGEQIQNANLVDPHDVVSDHFYIGGKIGWSAYDGACNSTNLDCQNDTFGYGLYGGYQFNRWLALEGGIVSYGEPEAKYSLGKISADVFGGELSVKVGYPISERLELFTRIGGSYQYIDKSSFISYQSTKSHEWNTFGALGTSFRISSNWSVRGEYQFMDGIGERDVGQSDLHFTSVGLTYHFGASEAASFDEEEVIDAPSQCELSDNSFSLNSVYLFTNDSYEIASPSSLEPVIERLSNCANETVRIVGYTDNTGSNRYNEMLSKLRAHSVATYLENQGIKSSRLEVLGLGEGDPIGSNETDEGRAENRRVEVRFITTKNIPSK